LPFNDNCKHLKKVNKSHLLILFFRLNQEQPCTVSSFAMTDVVVDDNDAGGVGAGLFPRNDANDGLASKALKFGTN
jgi:hypothetical protein